MATTKSKSLVWKHFERFGEKAKCSLCISGNILSCSGGSASALRKHLFSVHNIKFDDAQEAKGNTFSNKRIKLDDKQVSLLDYTNQQSLGEILSRLAAEDGFSYLRIFQSKFIRSSLSAKGFIPSKSHSTISIRVKEYSLQVKSSIKQELTEIFDLLCFFGKKISM